METFISDLSQKEFPISEQISGKTIRGSILNIIQKEYPLFTNKSHLSIGELNEYRQRYMEQFLTKQIGELTDLEKTVLASLKERSTLSNKVEGDDNQGMTFGQRVADKVASFGGSWTFIISFMTFLLIWIFGNVFWLVNRSFDPYPFILLNLILSSVAALQAPVIMMSQNRQEEKDREHAKMDYMVNLKSELEIRMLHEKVDHLIINQQQDILELQKTQVEMLSKIMEKVGK